MDNKLFLPCSVPAIFTCGGAMQIEISGLVFDHAEYQFIFIHSATQCHVMEMVRLMVVVVVVMVE
jgi:hypothetical protein